MRAPASRCALLRHRCEFSAFFYDLSGDWTKICQEFLTFYPLPHLLSSATSLPSLFYLLLYPLFINPLPSLLLSSWYTNSRGEGGIWPPAWGVEDDRWVVRGWGWPSAGVEDDRFTSSHFVVKYWKRIYYILTLTILNIALRIWNSKDQIVLFFCHKGTQRRVVV